MDKGLDITAGTRAVLACHAALHAAPLPAATPPPRNAAELLSALRARLRARSIPPDWDGADRCLEWAGEPERHILLRGAANYPPMLAAIARPPSVLFVRGEPAYLSAGQIAIVGARAASRGGRDFAQQLARDLASAGAVVTSGLARGIDAAAHRGALCAGAVTIAVLGHGPDRIYPAAHATLAAEIASGGALLTEFPPGYPPARRNFPQRNRLIAGLCLGTIVIEAARRSGSLSTARHALDEGREVFAVPGDPKHALSTGCHDLIRNGARLTTGIDDVLEELPQLAARPAETGAAGAGRDGRELPRDSRLVLDACGWGEFSVDMLAARTGATPQRIVQALVTLEIAGFVESRPGGGYVRIY